MSTLSHIKIKMAKSADKYHRNVAEPDPVVVAKH